MDMVINLIYFVILFALFYTIYSNGAKFLTCVEKIADSLETIAKNIENK